MTDHQHPDSDAWEGEMSSEFDRRVRDLHEAPLTFDTVRGRAVGIRRRRRAVAAGSLVAAAAVITPFAVGLATDSGPGRSDAPVASQTPTATDTAAPSGPGFAYLAGRDLHRADGSVVTLPGDYDGVADLDERVVAWSTPDTGGATVDVIEDGAVTSSYDAFNPPITSLSGSYVVLVTDDALQTVSGSGERAIDYAFDPQYVFPSVATGDDCATSCRIFLDTSEGRSIEVDLDGRESTPVPGAVKIRAATPEGDLLVASTLEPDGFTACSEVRDVAEDRAVLKTCDYRLDGLSPDGRYLLGVDPLSDGPGPRRVTILDTDLEEVGTLDFGEAWMPDIRWIDDDTLLVSVHDGRTWSAYTQDVGGALTRVLGPEPGDDAVPPFVLAD